MSGERNLYRKLKRRIAKDHRERPLEPGSPEAWRRFLSDAMCLAMARPVPKRILNLYMKKP
jgi:hypothetical protein